MDRVDVFQLMVMLTLINSSKLSALYDTGTDNQQLKPLNYASHIAAVGFVVQMTDLATCQYVIYLFYILTFFFILQVVLTTD